MGAAVLRTARPEDGPRVLRPRILRTPPTVLGTDRHPEDAPAYLRMSSYFSRCSCLDYDFDALPPLAHLQNDPFGSHCRKCGELGRNVPPRYRCPLAEQHGSHLPNEHCSYV